LRVGSRGAGEVSRQGAWGFKFWEQHVVIVSCLKGRGALSFGSSRREEKQCQNNTVQFFFYYYYYIFICGDPKMGYKNVYLSNNISWKYLSISIWYKYIFGSICIIYMYMSMKYIL
jgi:hypothetical protein